MRNVMSVRYVYIKHSAPIGKYKLKRRHYAFPTRPTLPKLQYSGRVTALNISDQRLLTFVFWTKRTDSHSFFTFYFETVKSLRYGSFNLYNTAFWAQVMKSCGGYGKPCFIPDCPIIYLRFTKKLLCNLEVKYITKYMSVRVCTRLPVSPPVITKGRNTRYKR